MSEQRHASPRDSVRIPFLCVSSVLCVLFVTGCDKVQIPDLTQQSAPPPAGDPGAAGVGKANSNAGAAPKDLPTQTAKPDPKASVAAFLDKAKEVGKLTDQDLLTITQLPEGLGEIKELRLVGGSITDTGIAALSKLPGLTSVDLAGSQVTNDGLKVIKDMPQLRSLGLSETKIDDQAMNIIGEKTDLKEIALARTGVTDVGLSLLSELKDLEVLDISNTTITGRGLEKFKNMKHLRVFRAQHSSFQSPAMKFLAHCPLEEINLDVTSANDAAMQYIAKMKTLKKLSMEYCAVTDLSIKKMVIMKDLESVSFRNTPGISALLFDRLKNSKNLKQVNVAGLTMIQPAHCAMLKKLLPNCQITR